MKTMFTIFVTVILSLPAFGDISKDCGGVFSNLGQEFDDLFGSNCSKSSMSAGLYCECLDKERNDNDLKNALHSKIGSVEDFNKKNFAENKKHLLNIYNNLNFEVSFQEHKFGMNRGSDQIGCTPKKMAAEFNSSLVNEHEDKNNKLIKGADQAPNISLDESDSQLLQRSITQINNDTKDRFKPYVPAPTSELSKVGLVGIMGSVNGFNGALESSLKSCSANPGITEEVKKSLINNLREAKKFFSQYDGLLVTTDITKIDTLISEMEKGEDCNLPVPLIQQINNEYLAKVKYSKKYSEKADTTPIAETIAAIDFAGTNKDLQKKFEASLLHTPDTACIDYNKFKAYNSAPKPDLIKLMNGKSAKDIEDLLDPGKTKSSTPMVEFFRKNPTIAKNTINPSQRSRVAKALVGLMGKIGNEKDEKKRFAAYSDFMRTDMADINADDKMMDLLQCDLLARNYAALASTDELPALGILEGQDQISGIANQYMACKVRDANLSKKLKDTKPDFNELIAANDLFSLFDTEPVTASNDKEYKDFQEKICPGFQKFVEDDLKSSCRITLFGKKHCRAKALNASKSRHGRLLKRYYEKNPEAKDLNDLISLKTQKLNVREMINKTNEGSQNKEVVRVYDNTIKPTLTNRSIYNTENIFRPSASGSSSSSPNKVADDKSGSSSDSDASIFKTVNKAQESYSNSSYANGSGKPGSPDSSIGNNPSGNSTNSNSDSSSTDNSISQGGSVNPGQVIPSFLNDSPVAPVTPAVDAKETTKIVSVDDVEDVIDDLDKLPADKRADYIQQSKNFLAQQNQSSEQIIDLNKKIAALENPGISRSIASSNVFIPNKTLGGGNLNQTTSPIVNKMNNSQVVGGTKISNNSMDKSAVSYKKALNQMNDKSDNSAEKIVVDDKSVFEFKGPINKSELPGDILVGVPLTPDSELFAQLSVAGAGNEHGEALKAYLAENLKSKEIPANQIISIKCTGQGCTRDNEMLLHISKDANNNLIIRSVAKDTLVTRSSANIDEFYNTIDLETKTKHKRHKKVKQ